ncbi:hypothetical protein JM946_29440 [Steroidobacter sp. S1-65]|uniref:Large polyvalent protein-associated domain-containing protein n=1 Tax=Steroidobacter gossypii TaxID=2805490 RepID=A0ABS1X6M4_9GAMM|nr:LPD7 domain-containing protein [Steroidobacter gossypii]MBM0108875.1 hypothetical protein [Steroidobacter gossypii]
MTSQDPLEEEDGATASARRRTDPVRSARLNAIAPGSLSSRPWNSERHDERANGRAHAGVGQPRAQGARQNARKRWEVPEEIRKRFLVTGNSYYFHGGQPAFVDRGDRLTTRSENIEVATSLAAIAQARGWREITVTGTETFKQLMWRAAERTGVIVRDDEATLRMQAEANRQVSPGASAAAEPAEHAELTLSQARTYEPRAPVTVSRPMSTAMFDDEASSDQALREWRGRLIEHGAAPYRNKTGNNPSYFIKLQTRGGKKTFWDADLNRALLTSFSRPKIGDEVVLRRWEHESDTIRRIARDEDAKRRPAASQIQHDRYVIETHDFLEERARFSRMVRDASVSSQIATQRHPQLAGSYLQLRLAQVVSQRLGHSEDQRRFMHIVRNAVADDIARGEPMRIVTLRSRAVARGISREQPARAAGLLRE